MPDDKHPDFDRLGPGEAVAGGFLGAVIGAFVGVVVNAATYSNKSQNPSLGESILTWAGICGAVGLVLGLVSFAVNDSRHRTYARERAEQAAAREREKLRQIEGSRTAYAAAYHEYLPKWQAWLQEYRRYTAALGVLACCRFSGHVVKLTRPSFRTRPG